MATHVRGSTWPIGKMCRGTNIHSYTNWQDIECFFSYLTDKQRSEALASLLLDFLKVIIIATFCLTPVIACSTSLSRCVRRNAGRAQGRRLKGGTKIYTAATKNFRNTRTFQTRNSIFLCFPGTTSAVWVLKSSGPLSREIWSRTPNDLGFSSHKNMAFLTLSTDILTFPQCKKTACRWRAIINSQ